MPATPELHAVWNETTIQLSDAGLDAKYRKFLKGWAERSDYMATHFRIERMYEHAVNYYAAACAAEAALRLAATDARYSARFAPITGARCVEIRTVNLKTGEEMPYSGVSIGMIEDESGLAVPNRSMDPLERFTAEDLDLAIDRARVEGTLAPAA